MKKLWKRWLSWVLVMAMSLSLLPTTILPGAMAIANMEISNFTIDANGNWSFNVAGQGTTGTMSVALILDARSDAALATNLPSYRCTHDDIGSADNGGGQKSLAEEAGLPAGAYAIISKPSQSPGLVSGTSSMTPAAIKQALLDSGATYYDASGEIDLSAVTSFKITLLVYAASDNDTTVRYLEKTITVPLPGKLVLSNALTVKTDSMADVNLSVCTPDAAADTVGSTGGRTATLTNVGDEPVYLRSFVTLNSESNWRVSFTFGGTEYTSSRTSTDLSATGIYLGKNESITLTLKFSTKDVVKAPTQNAGGGVEFVYTTNLGNTDNDVSLTVPYNFTRENGISATPIVITTDTATLAAGDVPGTSTVTIPASLLNGVYKWPATTGYRLNGTHATMFSFSTADVNPQTIITKANTAMTTSDPGSFTITVKAKQGDVAAGTYNAFLNVPFPKGSASANATVAIPITLNVTQSTGPRPYSIIFNANGVTATGMPSNTTLTPTTAGAAVSMSDPGSPTSTTHQFLGWATTPTGAVVTWPQSINSSRTYYAIWKAETYTVSYSTAHGTAPNSHENLTATDSFTVGNGATMTEAGWTFVQWEYPVGTAQSGSTTINALTSNNPQDVTLTAKWKQNQYTVKYKDDVDTVYTGTLPGDATVTYSAAINLPSLTQAGYTFDGWYYNGSKVSSGATISSLNSSLDDGDSITLEAGWTAQGISLKDQTINAKEGVALTSTTYQVEGGPVTGLTYTYQVKDPSSGNYVNSVTINGVTITGGATGLTVTGTPTTPGWIPLT